MICHYADSDREPECGKRIRLSLQVAMPHCSPVDLVVLCHFQVLSGLPIKARYPKNIEKSYSPTVGNSGWLGDPELLGWWLGMHNTPQRLGSHKIHKQWQYICKQKCKIVQDSARYCQHVKLCPAMSSYVKLLGLSWSWILGHRLSTLSDWVHSVHVRTAVAPRAPRSAMPMDPMGFTDADGTLLGSSRFLLLLSFGDFGACSVLFSHVNAMLTPCIAMHKDFASLHHLVLLEHTLSNITGTILPRTSASAGN